MAMSNIIELLKSAFLPTTSAEFEMLNCKSIRLLNAKLTQLHATAGDELIMSNDNVTNDLFILKADIDSFLKTATNQHHTASAEHFSQTFSNTLKPTTTFAAATELIFALDQLQITYLTTTLSTQKKHLAWRRLAWLMGALPMIGYGIHYVNSHYYQPIFIDELHMMYPFKSYTKMHKQLFIDDTQKTAWMKIFSRHFYRDYIMNNDSYTEAVKMLPAHYDLSWFEELEDYDSFDQPEVKEYIEKYDYLGLFSPDFPFSKQLMQDLKNGTYDWENFHLVHFRIFAKNTRDNHLINTIQLELVETANDIFPWSKLPVQSELAFTIAPPSFFKADAHNQSRLIIETNNAPAKNLFFNLAAKNTNNQTLATYSHSLSGYNEPKEIVSLAMTPSILVSNPYRDSNDLRFLFSTAAIKTPQDLATDFIYLDLNQNLQTQELSSYLSRAAYADKPLYLVCKEAGAVYFGQLPVLANALKMSEVSHFDIAYQYEQVDGVSQQTSTSILSSMGSWLLHDTISEDMKRIKKCIGEEAYNNPEIEKIAIVGSRASYGYQINKIATALMDKDEIAKSTIALSGHLLLDSDSTLAPAIQFLPNPVILQDGDYLQFDIWAMQLTGGAYQLNIYADDELLDTAEFEVIWPLDIEFEPSIHEDWLSHKTPTNK
jgi:hypothetical protein